MGQCISNAVSNVFRNVFNGMASTGAVPQAQQGQQQQHPQRQEGFHENAKPQHLYDAHGGRVFPEADKHRAEADRQAKMRGEKLGESQAAYQAGHKGNAHQLSVEGKRHGRLMEEANARAAKSIIEPQNSGETGVLDLHGLYVREAEGATKAFLLQQRRARRFREVEIITGTGQHSNHHQAKIRPAIERLINGLNMPYRNPPHNQGAFAVELLANQD